MISKILVGTLLSLLPMAVLYVRLNFGTLQHRANSTEYVPGNFILEDVVLPGLLMFLFCAYRLLLSSNVATQYGWIEPSPWTPDLKLPPSHLAGYVKFGFGILIFIGIVAIAALQPLDAITGYVLAFFVFGELFGQGVMIRLAKMARRVRRA